MTQPVPDLTTEQRLLAAGATSVAGIDEVGRGAWAGPVSVGVVLIVETDTPAPVGLRDSKLLSPTARERLAPLVSDWATSAAVGHASARECDELGMRAAIALAASRAIEQLDRVRWTCSSLRAWRCPQQWRTIAGDDRRRRWWRR